MTRVSGYAKEALLYEAVADAEVFNLLSDQGRAALDVLYRLHLIL
jgi:hypothetical protein